MEIRGLRVTPLDLEYLGCSEVIACYLLQSEGNVALVDPGPSSCLPVLRSKLASAGLSIADINSILLTHIHLDHAGATGSLVRENPRIRVFVHEKGAGHLIDPGRLVRSAARIYGDQMERLWGEFLPVPSENISSVLGGERIEAGGRGLEVLYTPGHACHHVSYFDDESGMAFVGDAAGIRIAKFPVVPVTPPPDIDVELWNSSLDAIGKKKVTSLCLTHFGRSVSVDWHIKALRQGLREWSVSVRRSLERTDSDEILSKVFAIEMRSQFRKTLPAEYVRRYETAITPEFAWHGLARYWRKRDTALS